MTERDVKVASSGNSGIKIMRSTAKKTKYDEDSDDESITIVRRRDVNYSIDSPKRSPMQSYNLLRTDKYPTSPSSDASNTPRSRMPGVTDFVFYFSFLRSITSKKTGVFFSPSTAAQNLGSLLFSIHREFTQEN